MGIFTLFIYLPLPYCNNPLPCTAQERSQHHTMLACRLPCHTRKPVTWASGVGIRLHVGNDALWLDVFVVLL